MTEVTFKATKGQLFAQISIFTAKQIAYAFKFKRIAPAGAITIYLNIINITGAQSSLTITLTQHIGY